MSVLKTWPKVRCDFHVRNVAGREREGEGPPDRVAENMEPGRSPAPRGTNLLRFGPPFATSGGALRLHVDVVHLRALPNRAALGEGFERPGPEPPPGPAVQTIVDFRR